MKKIKYIAIIFCLIFFISGCGNVEPVKIGQEIYEAEGVAIEDKGSYFQVDLDYTTGLSSREIGEAYARGILAVVPDYEAIMDSYIAESIQDYEYQYGINRSYDVRSQLPEAYYEEIEGMAMVFNSTENVWNDGVLSQDEVFIFNLFPDIIRGAQCCYISVYGDRSETGQNMVARNLDWYGGAQNQLSSLQAVTTIKYEDKQVCLIGYLGYQGALTAFNDDHVFAGILDAGTDQPYSSEGRRSYAMDLRYALENFESIDDAAAYMGNPSMLYTYNHTIGFSDSNTSVILENNFSGSSSIKGGRLKRGVRDENSKLNDGVEWGISNSIACVNSFLLYGNNDNHTNQNYNTRRWKNIKEQLLEKGESVSFEELREITSYYKGNSPGVFSESGDIYNRMTVQMMVFVPETFELEIYFPPRDSLFNPKEPVFETISVFQ